MPQHGSFGFNAAYTPSDHTKSVDHRGVRIGSHKRVGVSPLAAVLLLDEYSLRKVFEVHLMTNSNVRRHDAAILERFLTPFQKRVSFPVPLGFAICVESKSPGSTVLIDLDGMIDDQIDLLKGIDPFRVSTHSLDDVAHGRQIDNRRNTCEVLHQHTRRTERNFLFKALRGGRGYKRTYIIGRNRLPVFEAKQILQHHLQ